MVSAVELSYLPEEEQAAVKKVMDQNCIRLKADKAGELRKAAGSLSEEGQTRFHNGRYLHEPRKPGRIQTVMPCQHLISPGSRADNGGAGSSSRNSRTCWMTGA